MKVILNNKHDNEEPIAFVRNSYSQEPWIYFNTDYGEVFRVYMNLVSKASVSWKVLKDNSETYTPIYKGDSITLTF